MLYWSTLLMNAAITWKSSQASIFPKQHLFDILQKFLLGMFEQARDTLQSCEESLMLFEKKCREQNGSQPVWFHRDNFIMQTQHRIYVGKIYRTLELLPASTVLTPRCARNWLSKTWSSPKMLLTSSKLYEITSQASTEQVWKLLKQETSLAPKVDEISEERVSEREQAHTKRKQKSESSMCRASSTLQRSTKQNSWCSFPTIPFVQCFHVCTSIPTCTCAMPMLQLQVPTNFFDHFDINNKK